MKIKTALPPISAVRQNQYPEEQLPLILLLGRSNAGKSSLINTLINRKNLARTSSAPGKTRLLNFYRISAAGEDGAELSWFFVDLPGYGYAKAAKTERAKWLAIINELLQSGRHLCCWQLVDSRHQPSREDVAVHGALAEAGFPLQVIANKVDKISKNDRFKAKKSIAAALNIDAEAIIFFSAISKEGAPQLLQLAENFVRGQSFPAL